MTSNSSYGYNSRKLYKKIIRVLEAGWTPMIQSSPGMGKSSLVKNVAKKLNLKLIDHRLSTSAPEDMTGLPYFTSDGKAKFFPFNELFPLEGDELPIKEYTKDEAGNKVPVHYDGWLLFLDEFNSASKSVQAAAYKLILDRQIGQHNLHPHVCIVAAGNLATDRSLVNPLGTAMQSRMIHMELELDFDVWMEDVALKQGYDERIIGFLSFSKESLMNFRPEHNDKTFACPRTWEMVNDLIKDRPIESDDLQMLSGTIGPGAAVSFCTYVKSASDLVRVADIVADPEKCRIPTNVQLLFATVTHMLSNFEEKYIDAFITYIGRLDFQYRVLFMRGVAIRFPQYTHHPAYRRGATEIARYLRD